MNEFMESDVFRHILDRYIKEAEQVFKREVASSGLVMTGELISSIQAVGTEAGKDFVRGHVYFDMLLRIKDMKALQYLTIPPLSPMRIVAQQIVDRNEVYRVPGYKDGKMPSSDTILVDRLAWALRMHFKRSPNVRRGYRGIYNDPLRYQVLPYFFHDLRQAAGATALSQFRLMFQKD